MWPTLFGIHPPSLLFASTTTEAGELPIFSGIPDVKRLLFTKIASKVLSKSSDGSGPSKSLYRRSRREKGPQINVVNILECGQVEDNFGKQANEAVVTDIKLMEDNEAREGLRNDATETIGIDMEEGHVCQQSQLRWKIPGDVSPIQIDTCHSRHRVVV